MDRQQNARAEEGAASPDDVILDVDEGRAEHSQHLLSIIEPRALPVACRVSQVSSKPGESDSVLAWWERKAYNLNFMHFPAEVHGVTISRTRSSLTMILMQYGDKLANVKRVELWGYTQMELDQLCPVVPDCKSVRSHVQLAHIAMKNARDSGRNPTLGLEPHGDKVDYFLGWAIEEDATFKKNSCVNFRSMGGKRELDPMYQDSCEKLTKQYVLQSERDCEEIAIYV